MNTTLENFNQKSTEELIVIANSTTEEWQQIAIDKAQGILKQRKISPQRQMKILKEINDSFEEYLSIETKKRKTEDFTLFEKITIIIWWPRELIWGWQLRRDGFELKAKRRLQLIGLGILLTLIVIMWSNYQWTKDESKRQELIDNTDISDWEKNYYGVDSNGNILRPKE
jgi:hypothetical protein